MRSVVAILLASSAMFFGPGVDAARADQVVADDLIVEGGLCVGFDCVDGEAFPYDIIRVKENNTRIAFRDTGGGATGDWQLTANETGSGNRSRFAFENLTNQTLPFWVGAAAPTDSLRLTSDGRVGVGTAAPEAALHVAGALRIDGDLVVTGGVRAGRVDAATLGPDGRATVTFAVPYERAYAITLTPVLAKSKANASAIVVSHDETGFTLDVAGRPGDYLEIVWTTRFTGEF